MLTANAIINAALCSILLTLASFSEASDLFDFPVIDLSSGKNRTLSHDKAVNLVLFFEPDCSWCFKQTRVFNRFLQDCQADIQMMGFGVNGNRQQLKKEIWRQRADFPMYMASQSMLKAIGHISATPLTLLFDREGNILSHVRGYLPRDKWQALLLEHTGLKPECR